MSVDACSCISAAARLACRSGVPSREAKLSRRIAATAPPPAAVEASELGASCCCCWLGCGTLSRLPVRSSELAGVAKVPLVCAALRVLPLGACRDCCCDARCAGAAACCCGLASRLGSVCLLLLPAGKLDRGTLVCCSVTPS